MEKIGDRAPWFAFLCMCFCSETVYTFESECGQIEGESAQKVMASAKTMVQDSWCQFFSACLSSWFGELTHSIQNKLG